MENLKRISTDFFWCYWNEYLFSFGHPKLPTDVHFTIAFGENHEYINLHVTRNISDSTMKPKIRILQINRKLFFDDLEKTLLNLIRNILIPINLTELEVKALGCLSFDSLKEEKNKVVFEKLISEGLEPHTKWKRKRSKVQLKGELGETLSQIFKDDNWIETVENEISEFNPDEWKAIDGGMILTPNNTIQVLKIGDNWFEIKMPLELNDLMSGIIPTQTLPKIRMNIKRAIISVKNAKSYHEVEKLDSPITLTKKKL